MGKKSKKQEFEKKAGKESGNEKSKLDRKTYDAAILKLQAELVKLKRWVVATGERIIIVFEGRDAAAPEHRRQRAAV